MIRLPASISLISWVLVLLRCALVFGQSLGSDTRTEAIIEQNAPERYQFSREEVIAYRAQRYQRSKRAQARAVGNPTGHVLVKRDSSANDECERHDWSIKDRWGTWVKQEEHWWIAAECIAPYNGPLFHVWCLPYARDEFQRWRIGRVKHFIGECDPGEYCIDGTAKTNGVPNNYGQYNSVDCVSRESSDDDEEEHGHLEALRASKYEELKSCSRTKTIPESFSLLPVNQPSHSKKYRRRVYNMQEEMTLLHGGDYKAASLYFRDMDAPYHMEIRRAERVDANVTQTEIIIDSHGITKRNFQFCTRLKKSTDRHGGPWVVMYHSVHDITDETHHLQGVSKQALVA